MKAVRSGDPSELERVLVGRRIWVLVPADKELKITEQCYDVRVTGLKAFHPAGPNGHGGLRKKHLVQIWTDPGGLRTLSVGSLHLKNPYKAS